MALIKNEVGEWAWVSDAAERPLKFFATKDEALKNAKAEKSGKTSDSGDRCYTVERGEFAS